MTKEQGLRLATRMAPREPIAFDENMLWMESLEYKAMGCLGQGYLRLLAEFEEAIAFIRGIAKNPLCGDPGESEKCALDSGPSCGVHDYWSISDVEAARAFLARKP